MKRNILHIIFLFCATCILNCNAQSGEKSNSIVTLYAEGTGIHVNKDSAQIIALTNAVRQLVAHISLKESIGEYPMERMEMERYDSGKTIENKGVGELLSESMMVRDKFELIDEHYHYSVMILINAIRVNYPSANVFYNKTDNADSPLE